MPNVFRRPLPLQEVERRWIYAYALSGVVMSIGLITLLFMLRVG